MSYYKLLEGIQDLTEALDAHEIPEEILPKVLAILAVENDLAKMAREVAVKYSGNFDLALAAEAMLRALKAPIGGETEAVAKEPELYAIELDKPEDLSIKAHTPVSIRAMTYRDFLVNQEVTVNGTHYNGYGKVTKVRPEEDKVFVRCGDGKLRSYNSGDLASGKLIPA